MDDLWYKNAIVYGVDVKSFYDSNGDGIGDFAGLSEKLPYIAELGVTALWLLPFYPSPWRDNGYDISNYLGVDPRLGKLTDFTNLVHRAGEYGIRVIADLVMNHSSKEHPWFEAARRDPNSRYRDYYIWDESPSPPAPGEGTIFPGQEETVWTFDDVARAYYYHRFYCSEPELNFANPEVRDEILRTMDLWISLGVAGFRMDAVSHMVEKSHLTSRSKGDPHEFLRRIREYASQRRPDIVLLGEADVKLGRVMDFFGGGDEMNMLFNFLLTNYYFLALATQRAEPLVHILPHLTNLPRHAQWLNFMRNLDEADLEQLSETEREQAYAQFAPDPEMRIYGRGVRRRIAPMLKGDRRWMKLAYSLLFSIPGAPCLVYGDEIGMGEDLSQPGRNAVRSPMQWSDAPNAGFSSARQLIRPAIDKGPFAYRKVNVAQQEQDPDSFLHWVRQLIAARRQCPEIGCGEYRHLPVDAPSVLAHRCEWQGRLFLALHNLSDQPVQICLDLSDQLPQQTLHTILGQGEPLPTGAAREIHLEGYEFHWYRGDERL